MTVTIGEQDLERALEVMDVLAKYSLVDQQKALEICLLRHAGGMGNARDAAFVIDSFHKHVKQMLKQYTQDTKSDWWYTP